MVQGLSCNNGVEKKYMFIKTLARIAYKAINLAPHNKIIKTCMHRSKLVPKNGCYRMVRTSLNLSQMCESGVEAAHAIDEKHTRLPSKLLPLQHKRCNKSNAAQFAL